MYLIGWEIDMYVLDWICSNSLGFVGGKREKERHDELLINRARPTLPVLYQTTNSPINIRMFVWRFVAKREGAG